MTTPRLQGRPPTAPRARWTLNGRFLAAPSVTGVQRYALEITKAIDAAIVADAALARALEIDIALPADAGEAPPLQAITVRRPSGMRGHAWEQLALPRAAPGGLISLANLGPVAHGRQILCIHDANVYLEPDSYSSAFRTTYRALLPRLARRARPTVTVSRFSSDMLERFRLTPGPSAVIGNGHEHALAWRAERSRFAAPEAFERPFVFMLGSRARYKQADLLLKLAPRLAAAGVDLVVSGGRSSIFAAESEGESPFVRTLGFVSDDDLAALFRRALAFVFPSRTEGFGIPLLEAMVHGCPVVASDAASMPEVCGDAALYAPPHAPQVWLDRILALHASENLRAELRARGAQRYPRFSWREGGRRFAELAVARSRSPA